MAKKFSIALLMSALLLSLFFAPVAQATTNCSSSPDPRSCNAAYSVYEREFGPDNDGCADIVETNVGNGYFIAMYVGRDPPNVPPVSQQDYPGAYTKITEQLPHPVSGVCQPGSKWACSIEWPGAGRADVWWTGSFLYVDGYYHGVPYGGVSSNGATGSCCGGAAHAGGFAGSLPNGIRIDGYLA